MKRLQVGYSSCPNDTFLFFAAVHGLVDTEGYHFDPVLEDVETLNQWALEGRLPLTKASYGALGALCNRYWCLRSGGALGRGCGPLVVAKEPEPLESLAQKPIAVPGFHTTANLLLQLRLGRACERSALVFKDIMPAVAEGRFSAGVIIHESRFTFRDYGLVAVEDLGDWWEKTTSLPIPLGCILLRRDLPGVNPATVERVVRRSVEYALANPEQPMDYVRQYAQEQDDCITRNHIRLYVNAFSADVSEEGEQAVHAFLSRARQAGLVESCSAPIFPALKT